jgi:tetratricopeptide (TPR) repeat protein
VGRRHPRHTAAIQAARHLGDRRGQANALGELGVVWRMTGDYPAAAQDLEQALGIYRDLGDRSGEAETLNETGTLHRVSGDNAQAEKCHQHALELAHAIASSWDEAHALAGLGRCALAAAHATQARVLLRQALEIFQRIGAAETPGLRAEFDALTGRAPAQPPVTGAATPHAGRSGRKDRSFPRIAAGAVAARDAHLRPR